MRNTCLLLTGRECDACHAGEPCTAAIALESEQSDDHEPNA